MTIGRIRSHSKALNRFNRGYKQWANSADFSVEWKGWEAYCQTCIAQVKRYAHMDLGIFYTPKHKRKGAPKHKRM